MVNSEYLAKFKKLYKDKYNIDLNDEEASELGSHFLNLMKILIKPKTKPELPTLNEEEKQEFLDAGGLE